MALFPTNTAQVQTFATALYGVQVGSVTMAQVNNDILSSGGLNNALNAYYTASFGTATTASVATTIVANIGLGTDANAIAFVTAQLNAAAPAARGAAVIAMLDNFLNTTSGTYAAAAAAYNTTVATAVAYTGSANAVNGTVAAPTPFVLTTGLDAVVGGTGNDTINAADVFLGLNGATPVYANTFGAGDNIDGGAGLNTFNVASAAAITVPTATVKNIQTANLTSASTVNGDVSGWTGLTALNVTAVGGTNSSTVKAAGTTAVTYTDSAIASAAVAIDGGSSVASTTTSVIAATTGTVTIGGTTAPLGAVTVSHTIKGADTKVGGAITTTGGTSVSITQAAANAVNTTNTFGAVTVHGTALTTSVSSTQTNAATAAAAVVGVVNGAVAINDYNTTDATTAQTSTTKAGTISTVSVTGGAAVTINSPALSTLNLGGTITSVATLEQGSTATTNLTLALNLNAATVANAITDSSNQFTTVNLTNTGTTKLYDATHTALADTALKTLTIANTGTLTGNFTNSSITSIDASASTGTTNAVVDATVSTYSGGSGVDSVTIAAAPTKAISGGAGTADELVMNVAAGTFANPSANSKISGFEVLGLGAAATGTYDATGFTALHVGVASITGDSVFSNVAAGTPLTIDAAPAKVISYALKDATGTSDSVSITVNKATADGLDLSGKNVDITGIESVTISSLGTETATAAANKIKLADTTATTSVLTKITISGNQDITVSDALTGTAKIATVDASAVTGKVDLSGIHVSATGSIITGSTTNTNSLTGGAGPDTITGGAKADTITSGAGLDILTGGAGQDTFVLAANANGNVYATITDAALGSSTTADKIDMTALTAHVLAATTVLGTKLSLGDTAAFADYLAAAATGHAAAATNAVVSWFQFNGNTFIVTDNTNADVFTNGTGGDQVVKLTGLIDLSKASETTSGVLTLLNA